MNAASQHEIVTKTSALSVTDTVAKLAGIIDAGGLKLFATIDQKAEAEQAGLALRATTLVIFGSPASGTPIMVASPLAALDLPLKVLIWDDNGTTKVSYVAPEVVSARYELTPDLAERLLGLHLFTDILVAP